MNNSMRLEEFFSEHPKIALAYSGGVDSAYLLYEAVRFKVDVAAYYARSAFQPEFEYKQAMSFAEALGIRPKAIELDVLSSPEICANPAKRCYYCKKMIMAAIKRQAYSDGYDIIIDGTNASDDISDRPGYRALSEENVLSPLRLCSITKNEIRSRSKQAGLITWNRPAYACLATRIATGEAIDTEKLNAVEKAEDYLFSLGFSDFRVRTKNTVALLQFTDEQHENAEAHFDEIIKALPSYFSRVELDPVRREKSL